MKFTGVVQRGGQRGRALGYPTINLALESSDVSGIYAARVSIKDESPYMAAVFADPGRKVLEAHILDFSDDLYALEVEVELFEKIRESARFESYEELKRAIESDIAKVREYFRSRYK